MFYYCHSLSELNVSNWETSSLLNLMQMFYKAGYNSNKFILSGVSEWDTSKDGAFYYAGHNAETFDIGNLSNWNTANVTNMETMFREIGYSAETCDIGNFSGWNTSNVTTMMGMFDGCSKLTTLDLNNFDTSKVNTMDAMFVNCVSLENIYVSNKWNTDAVTNSEDMFKNCTNLVGGFGTTYDANNIDKTYARIDGGTSSPGYLTLKTA